MNYKQFTAVKEKENGNKRTDDFILTADDGQG